MIDMDDTFDHAAIAFIRRTPVPTGVIYQRVDIRTPDGRLHTSVVPRIGDRVTLGANLYRIVDMEWDPPSMGSPVWPYPTGLIPGAGIMINAMVEQASGMYVDEVPDPGEQ